LTQEKTAIIVLAEAARRISAPKTGSFCELMSRLKTGPTKYNI